MSGNRLAARIAARESARRPFRSLLVALLVALPVAGMTAATTIVRTEAETPIEQYRDEFGDADLGFIGYVGTDADDEFEKASAAARAALPPGSKAHLYSSWQQALRTDDAIGYTELRSGDFTDPVLAGRYRVTEGRLARAGGEVAVSAAFAAHFDTAPGEILELTRPDVELDVVGLVEDTDNLSSEALYFSSAPPSGLIGNTGEQIRALVEVPGDLDFAAVRRLLDASESAALPFPEVRPTDAVIAELDARGFYPDPATETAIRWSIVAGALVLAVVGIIIAAAFTVGARQQLTILGQLSSNGAPERLRRRVLVLQGTVTGAVGAAAGIVVASVGLRLGQSLFERIVDHRIDDFTTRISDLVVVAAVGMVGASAAALIPARSASRIPTLQALAGRRPEAPVSRRFTIGGTVAFGAGLALLAVAATGGRSDADGNLWAAVAVIGGLGVLFGATATTPALVAAVAPLSRRTNGSARLAVRNLTRHRTRTGAVVAAVAAAGALAIGGTAISRSAVADTYAYSELAPGVVSVYAYGGDSGDRFPTPPPDLVARVARAVGPDATRRVVPRITSDVEVRGRSDTTYGFDDSAAFVIDDELAAGLELGSEFREVLDEHGVAIVKFDDGADDQTVSVSLGDNDPITTEVLFSRHSLGLGSGTYVTPERARAAGLETAPGPLLFLTPEAGLSDVQRFDLQELQRDQYERSYDSETGARIGPEFSIDYRSPSTSVSPRVVEAALAGLATLLALIVLGIGLALAAADDREEATTMAVIGADPGTRTRTVATKAWIMAALGFLLAVPIGYLPVLVVQSSGGSPSDVPFPFGLVVVLLVVAPMLAAAATAIVGTIGTRLRPLQLSTAMFD